MGHAGTVRRNGRRVVPLAPRRLTAWASRKEQLYVLVALLVTVINLIGLFHRLDLPTLCNVSTGSSSLRQRPIVVQIEGTIDAILPLQLEAKPAHLIKQRKNRYWVNHRIYAHVQLKELEDGCEYLGSWMNDIHPSCNIIHEIDTTDFFMNKNRTSVRVDGAKRRKHTFHIGSGAYRNAFMVTEFNGARRVLKTFRYADNLNVHHQSIEKMRLDAVAMEQLTASPYVADIYGYCSLSSLVDYSNEDDLSEIFYQKQSKDNLYEIAYAVAASVADTHHPNAEGRPTIVHLDIKPDQWILMNGKYVLQDFNLAQFLSWNSERQQNCGRAMGWKGGRVSEKMSA